MKPVTLVGAGPGDPGLITWLGIEALRAADVIVYDYLSADELLRYARSDAERIYAGKRAGHHTLTQDEINALLVERARADQAVVRLKGGDPYVFGRGGEECLALAKADVPFEVVPGVTSAVAAPAYAGIPLTQRGLSSSVAIVTGHEDPTKDESALDWEALARIDTLVILMGVGKLALNVAHLRRHGRSPETPVALVEWGTRGVQRTVTGTLADIVDRVRQAGLKPPAVTVVGDTVDLRQHLNWFESRPLYNLRVLVTRTRQQASAFARALRHLGAEPVECPLIAIVPPEDWAPLDDAIQRLGAYDGVLFTSANGVASFFQRLDAAKLDARALAGARLATIGPATAEALAEHGLRADLVPEQYVAEAMAAALGDVAGERLLLPRADIARPALARLLTEAGATVDEVTAYRTVQPDGLAADLRDALPQVDVVTFTSSSTVRHFVRALGEDEARAALSARTVACIGPITAGTAREFGVSPALVAEEHTIDGLIDTLVAWKMNPMEVTSICSA